MPGANYMGGKRSVMKARVKDTVGRKQKGFFGRQRLDILSQGLSASKPSEKLHLPPPPLSSSKGRAEIDLAHARQKIPLEENTAARGFIPSPIRISPSTPRSRKRIRTQNAHTSSSSSASRSKILEALDTSQPLFARRAMDQILAMPDLAGLSKREDPILCKKSERLDQRIGNERERGEKRKSLDEDEEDLDPRSKIELKKQPKVIKYTPRAPTQFYTPPTEGEKYRTDNRPLLNRKYYQRSTRRGASISPDDNDSEDGIPSTDSPDTFTFHDSGFSDGRVERNVYSSPWSTQQHQSSSRTSEYDDPGVQSEYDASPKVLSSPGSKMRTAITSSLRISKEQINESQGHSDSSEQDMGLPMSIKLGPRRRWPHSGGNIEKDELSVYGSLFEQSDPWRTVGFILGLQEADSEMANPSLDILAVTGEVFHTENGVFDPPSPSMDVLLEEVWEDEEKIMSDINFIMDEFEQEQPFVPDWSDPTSSPTSSPENNRVQQFSPMFLEDHEDWQIDRRQSPFLSREMDGDSLCSDIVGENIPSTPNLLDDIAFDPMQSFGEDIAVNRQETPEIKDEIDNQNVQGSDSYTRSPRILAIPVLREVNGRFLGPSLFDDFDESEDDS